MQQRQQNIQPNLFCVFLPLFIVAFFSCCYSFIHSFTQLMHIISQIKYANKQALWSICMARLTCNSILWAFGGFFLLLLLLLLLFTMLRWFKRNQLLKQYPWNMHTVWFYLVFFFFFSLVLDFHFCCVLLYVRGRCLLLSFLHNAKRLDWCLNGWNDVKIGNGLRLMWFVYSQTLKHLDTYDA